MAFEYDPNNAWPCMPPGSYKATLVGINEGSSPKGLPMLVLKFDVAHDDRQRRIRGWITNPTSLFFLRELAIALDAEKAFLEGQFDAAEYIGCELLVELRVIQTDMFGDQNVVAHYHRADPNRAVVPTFRVGTREGMRNIAAEAKERAEQIGADDIPFGS